MRALAEALMPKKSDRAAAFTLPKKVVSQLADLAGVPKGSRSKFGKLIAEAIGMAEVEQSISPANLPSPRPSDVDREARHISTIAKNLDEALGALEKRDADPVRYKAKILLFARLGGVADRRRWLTELLKNVEEAASGAPSVFKTLRGKGRPKGIGGNPALNMFVWRLIEIARITGGRWTHYRDRGSESEIKWLGTLLPAMEILRPYLPEGFIPLAGLGRSLEHLVGQLRHATKNGVPSS
jgi:hypothetical protein